MLQVVAAFIILVVPSTTSATELGLRLIEAGALSRDADILKPSIIQLLAGVVTRAKQVRINDLCPTKADICIYIVDRRRLTSSIKRRYASYFSKLSFNMLSISPNIILIDAALIRLQIVVFQIQLALLSQREFVLGEARKQTDEVAAQHLEEIYRILARHEMFSATTIGTESESFAGILRDFLAALPPPFGPDIVSLSFLWHVLHEIGHLQQFDGDDQTGVGTGRGMVLPWRELHRLLEADADRFASTSLLRLYATRFAKAPTYAELRSMFAPTQAAAAGIASSALTWQTVGLERLFSHRFPLRISDEFLFFDLRACKEYRDMATRHIPLKGLRESNARVQIDFSAIDDVSERGFFLIEEASFDFLRRKLSWLRSQRIYAFDYERFAPVLGISDAAMHASKLPRLTGTEANLIDALQHNDPERFQPPRNTKSTSLRFDELEEKWRTSLETVSGVKLRSHRAANCGTQKCAIYTLSHEGDGIATAEVVANASDQKILSVFGTLLYPFSLYGETSKEVLRTKKEFMLTEAFIRPFVTATKQYATRDEMSESFDEEVLENFNNDRHQALAAAMLVQLLARQQICGYGTASLRSDGREVLSITSHRNLPSSTFFFRAAE